MLLSRVAKAAVRRAFGLAGYEVYRRPHLPKGTDVFQSIASHWPAWSPEVIFDVGANVGQTVRRLRPLFPEALIHAFEPGPAAFARLRESVAGDGLVCCHDLALGDSPGERWLELHPSSDQSSMVPALRTCGGQGVAVRQDTISGFCARAGVGRVGLLKIDVEGYELAVLAGAETLFSRSAVHFIVSEAGLARGNPRFTPLTSLIERLEPHGFVLIGVYEQFGVRHPQAAEFCNALFAHERHLARP